MDHVQSGCFLTNQSFGGSLYWHRDRQQVRSIGELQQNRVMRSWRVGESGDPRTGRFTKSDNPVSEVRLHALVWATPFAGVLKSIFRSIDQAHQDDRASQATRSLLRVFWVLGTCGIDLFLWHQRSLLKPSTRSWRLHWAPWNPFPELVTQPLKPSCDEARVSSERRFHLTRYSPFCFLIGCCRAWDAFRFRDSEHQLTSKARIQDFLLAPSTVMYGKTVTRMTATKDLLESRRVSRRGGSKRSSVCYPRYHGQFKV